MTRKCKRWGACTNTHGICLCSLRAGPPTDDTPSFTAEEPEHCHSCWRLIRPGQTHYLTIGNAILCSDWNRADDTIRLSLSLAVELGENLLLLRRADVAVEVLPGELQHPDGMVRLGHPSLTATGVFGEYAENAALSLEALMGLKWT